MRVCPNPESIDFLGVLTDSIKNSVNKSVLINMEVLQWKQK